MSTPSTATITVPPNHQYYPHTSRYLPPITDYHHSASYQQPPPRTAQPQYPTTYHSNQASSDYRRAAPAEPRQSHSANSQYYDAPTTSQNMDSSKKKDREDPVDWNKYFNGKLPKEIIVIDDDSPAPEQKPTAPAHTKQAPPPLPATTSGAVRHTDKRRKTANTTTYDPVYQQQNTTYSNTQTPYYDDSPGNYTGSTGRTASYNTTAPTSLGSSSSGGYLEDTSVGQKRKRSTRQAAADQKKREIEYRSDPFSEYIAPPKPPIKAKDVHVPVVADVCRDHPWGPRLNTDTKQRTASRDQKVDDDDGHYTVVENADLTERCKLSVSA